MAKKQQRPRHGKPDKAEKKERQAYLQGLGVEPGLAKTLAGEDEDVTREEIIRRRIEWQRGLRRG